MTIMQGKILGGRYQIISHLGRGGFGTTFVAEDRHLPGNPQCVVKQLKPKRNSDDPLVLQAARRLFDREAEVLYQLGNHERIPRLFAHFEEDGDFYLVQELIDGNELRKELQLGQQLSEAQVIVICGEILEILEFVHQQDVIHRDIKPSNLIRRRQDGKIVLIDFGAVKQIGTQVIDSQGQTSLTIAIGSPGYMPNEQLAGNPRFCSDIYAVGILGIQALTGLNPRQFPEDLKTSEIIWRDQVRVSSDLADILDKMVRYDFRERYQSAAEVLEAFNGLTPRPFTPTLTTSEDTCPTIPVTAETRNPSLLTTVGVGIVSKDLSGEQDVDYTRLRDLLAAGKWQEADRETQAVMLKVSGREQQGWIRVTDMDKFPCEALSTIDQLWVQYSHGRFGFSVQQRIWQSVGGNQHEDYETSCCFAEQVGWRVNGNWVLWNELNFSSLAPVGHLPALAVDGGEGFGGEPGEESLFARVESCELHEPVEVLANVQPETLIDDLSSKRGGVS